MDNTVLRRELFQALHRSKQLNPFFRFGRLSRMEFFLLEALHDFQQRNPDRAGPYVSNLAARMRMSAPGISRMLRQLEEEGYVERTVDRENRRNTYIHITREGEKERENVHTEMSTFMDTLIMAMGEEDMLALLTLWSRLLTVLESQLKPMQTQPLQEGESKCSR